MDHYLVISSDCHAGPETPDYKPYVDSKYHDAFDQCSPWICANRCAAST